MNILVTGSNGQIGKSLKEVSLNFNYDCIFLPKKSLDITSSRSIKKAFLKYKPDIIINAAAYTDVDGAELNQNSAFYINETGPKLLAVHCSEADIPIIHFSTDYVFDGLSSVPYKPNDFTSPQTVYGASKLAGERAIKLYANSYIIIRTSWVFSRHGKNFLKTMLKLAESQNKISVVNDQFGNPTFSDDIAHTTFMLVTEALAKRSLQKIFHYGGDTICSWFDFANEIFSQANLLYLTYSPPIISPCLSSDFSTSATRPLFSGLDSSDICSFLNIRPSDWKNGITSILNEQIKLQNES
jgi:dTDP-4-dehydrorhamnose reductase